MEKKLSLQLKTEIIICIFLIITGLFGLIILSNYKQVSKISYLLDKTDGKYFVSGFVNDSYVVNNTTRFLLSDNTGKINSIIFDNINLETGSILKATCQIKVYNNVVECIFSKKDVKLEK